MVNSTLMNPAVLLHFFYLIFLSYQVYLKNVNDYEISKRNLLYTVGPFIRKLNSTNFLLPVNYSFSSLPNAEDNLQQSANTRDEENGTDEVTLCEAIMLQTQPLRQD